MTTKHILVIGYAQQTQTAQQIRMLRDFGVKVSLLNPYGEEGVYAALQWQDQTINWSGGKLPSSSIDAVLVCANAPELPTQAAFQSQADGKLDWATWFQHYGVQRDRSDTLLSVLMCYDDMGIPCFNPVSKSLLSRRKPYQLHKLRQANCPLPATLISNDPAAATDFINSHGDCIVKPAGGGSLTLSANELLAQDQLGQVTAAPAIFQQRILGRDIRVMVIDGEVASSAIIQVPENTLDFRGNTDYQSGRVHYEAITLPDDIQQACQRAAHTLGLRVTGIDIRVTPDNEYIMLECNSSPIYLDVEYKLKHPITQQLCQALMDAC